MERFFYGLVYISGLQVDPPQIFTGVPRIPVKVGSNCGDNRPGCLKGVILDDLRALSTEVYTQYGFAFSVVRN